MGEDFLRRVPFILSEVATLVTFTSVPRPNQNPGLSKTNVQQRTFFNFKGNRERSCKVFQFIPGIEVILLLLEVLTIKVIPMRQERRIISLFCLH